MQHKNAVLPTIAEDLIDISILNLTYDFGCSLLLILRKYNRE